MSFSFDSLFAKFKVMSKSSNLTRFIISTIRGFIEKQAIMILM